MKHLIVISGPPGAGKSCLARNISEQLGILWFDYDDIAQPIIASLSEQQALAEHSQWAKIAKNGFYTVLMDLSCKMLAVQDNVIISAPFTNIRVSNKNFFSKYKKRNSACIVEILIKISEQKLKEQIFKRNLQRDLYKIGDWENFYKRINDGFSVWEPDTLIQYNIDKIQETSVIDSVKRILMFD